jgi:hypothetical protein
MINTSNLDGFWPSDTPQIPNETDTECMYGMMAQLETCEVDTTAFPVGTNTNNEDELHASAKEGEQELGNKDEDESKKALHNAQHSGDKVGNEASTKNILSVQTRPRR